MIQSGLIMVLLKVLAIGLGILSATSGLALMFEVYGSESQPLGMGIMFKLAVTGILIAMFAVSFSMMLIVLSLTC